MDKNKIIEFVESLIDSYKTEAEGNISERSCDTQKDFEDLEKECIGLKKEFKELIGES